jgi:radical SAM protein with 4Fe4S-binding SPASM domain
MAYSNNSNFCIRPFNSLVLSTNGDLRPCCKIEEKKFNIKSSSIEQYWQSDYLINLRKKFLENQKPAECKRCWSEENKNLMSHRQKSNFEYKAIFKNNYIKNLKLIGKDNLNYPEDIELALTNVCNLKCQMCRGSESSKLLRENNYLNFENYNQSDFELNENTYSKIEEILEKDLKFLNLRGGEPLVNKNIINILEKLVKNKKSKIITLHITTNGTICNKKIINLLSQFTNLKLMLSIESVGKYNNYIRYPSDWKTIKKNILQFKNLKNAYLCINTVVQNLNLLYLEPLISFAHAQKIFINFYKLTDPHYLEFDNLPLHILKESYNRLTKIDKTKFIHSQNIREIISLLESKINNYCHDENKFTLFKDMIKKRDQYRKISISDYMPEIYNVI